MLARLQRMVTVGLLACAVLWASFWWHRGQLMVGAVGGLAVLCFPAIVLAVEFVLVAYVNRNDPTPRPGSSRLLRAWRGEVLASSRVFFWRQPFRANRFPDHLPDGARGHRGVVLVHGFVCNRGLWNPLMEWLRSNDVPYVAVNLEPVFGSIDAYPGTIEGAVRRLEQATGLSPLIVAHSMGGLAVRAWLHLHGGDARVSRVITIASPHAGTWLARFGVTVNARQMRVRSSWLLRLVALEPASRYRRFVCYYSHCDNIVLPASTATLPGADNRHVPGTAHVELVHHKRIWLDVLAELRGGSTVPSAAIDAPKSSVA